MGRHEKLDMSAESVSAEKGSTDCDCSQASDEKGTGRGVKLAVFFGVFALAAGTAVFSMQPSKPSQALEVKSEPAVPVAPNAQPAATAPTPQEKDPQSCSCAE